MNTAGSTASGKVELETVYLPFAKIKYPKELTWLTRVYK